MDEKDLKILDELETNARISFIELGKKLKMSESAVRKRVRKLEKEGIIEKYTIIVNPAKLGYNTVSVIGLDVAPEKYLETIDRLAGMDEVKSVIVSTGDHMIMAEVWSRSAKDLSDFVLKKIGELEGVSRVCPAIILEKRK